MATKFVYTDTEVQEITKQYAAGISLDSLASQYNKSVASVRMKLVKLGVYQKAAAKSVAKLDTKPEAMTASSAKTKAEVLAVYTAALSAVGPALM